MWSRILFQLAIVLLLADSSDAQQIAGVSPKSDGSVTVTHTDNTAHTIPPDEDQAELGEIVVSADGRAAGWTVNIKNCCTSYAVPVRVVTYRDGSVSRLSIPMMVHEWTFKERGEQTAVLFGPVHGNPVGAELYDTLSGTQLAEWDLLGEAPGWAQGWPEHRDAKAAPPEITSAEEELRDAVALLWTGRVEEGVSALREKAEVGSVAAQLFLGRIYSAERAKSPIRRLDFAEAMTWFRRASAQGSGEASAAIAELFERGLGVPQSSEESARWLELAAAQGWVEQQIQVNCFIRTVGADGLTCDRARSAGACPTEDEMEMLRSAGVTGVLRHTGGTSAGQQGPQARAVIVLDQQVTSETRLKQPRYATVIYVQRGASWQQLPTQIATLDRPILLKPQEDRPEHTMVSAQSVSGGLTGGGCVSWPRQQPLQ